MIFICFIEAKVSFTTASGADAEILEANEDRLGATVYNNSSIVMYLKLGSSATVDSFTALMSPGAYYEVPFSYRGSIHAYWATSGNALVTEFTD